ncbi:MAG: hypothetical protein GY777_18460 [Candidatus Brocadiaceae bacterium]|nr:hypothetical protein [Candidatus Brocadiaceae bacterium]
MEQYSPQLIVALVTAAVTATVALISVHLTHRGQRLRDEAQFKREHDLAKTEFTRKRLEELYELFAKWESDVGNLYLTFLPVVSGNMSEKDAWDISTKNQLSDKGSWQRLNMIVNMYFPELNEHLEPVLIARTVASRFIDGGQLSSENQKRFNQAQQNFDEATDNFLQEIAKTSHAL